MAAFLCWFLWTSTYLLAFFNFKWCDPEESTSSWSSIEGVACDDNDNCTKGDICSDGQCTGTRFTCDLPCQECNGNGCSLKTGYGFVSNRCTCKITGRLNYIPLQVFWIKRLWLDSRTSLNIFLLPSPRPFPPPRFRSYGDQSFCQVILQSIFLS